MAALSQVGRTPQETRFLKEVGGTFSTENYEKKFQPSFELFLGQFQEVKSKTLSQVNPSSTVDPKLSDIAKKSMENFWKMAGDKWQSYVVRKSGWSTNKDLNYGGMESQAVYGEWLYQSAQIGASCLRDKNWSFRQLESFCAYRRAQIAEMLNIPNAKQYGLFKDTNQWTPCHSGYTYLREKLELLHASSKEKQTGTSHSYYIPTSKTKNIDSNLMSSLSTLNVSCGAFFSEINGKPVRLSEVLICPTHTLQSETEQKYLYFDPKAGHSVTVFHTKAKEKKIEKILAHTEQIFNDSMKETDRDLFVQKLGKVFWLMCQCKPYFWGDPSIAETMFKAQAYSKGYDVPPWKADLVPWEKVMEQPDVEQFAKDFHTFFDGKWKKA